MHRKIPHTFGTIFFFLKKEASWREQEHGTKSIRCMHNVTFQLEYNVIYWDFIPGFFSRFALLCSFFVSVSLFVFHSITRLETKKKLNKLFARQFMIVRIKLNKRPGLQNHCVNCVLCCWAAWLRRVDALSFPLLSFLNVAFFLSFFLSYSFRFCHDGLPFFSALRSYISAVSTSSLYDSIHQKLKEKKMLHKANCN